MLPGLVVLNAGVEEYQDGGGGDGAESPNRFSGTEAGVCGEVRCQGARLPCFGLVVYEAPLLSCHNNYRSCYEISGA